MNNKNKPLMYRVKLGWDPKYIIHFNEKLNAKNDNHAKKIAQKISILGGYDFFEVLVYREGKDLPEVI